MIIFRGFDEAEVLIFVFELWYWSNCIRVVAKIHEKIIDIIKLIYIPVEGSFLILHIDEFIRAFGKLLCYVVYLSFKKDGKRRSMYISGPIDTYKVRTAIIVATLIKWDIVSRQEQSVRWLNFQQFL